MKKIILGLALLVLPVLSYAKPSQNMLSSENLVNAEEICKDPEHVEGSAKGIQEVLKGRGLIVEEWKEHNNMFVKDMVPGLVLCARHVDVVINHQGQKIEKKGQLVTWEIVYDEEAYQEWFSSQMREIIEKLGE